MPENFLHSENAVLHSMPETFLHSENAGNFPTLMRMPEIFLHRECRKFPTLRECRKISRMPEIFLHSENAGNFPALRECRKFSCTQRMPEIFLHSENAGNFPALRECRKFSCTQRMPYYTQRMPENFLHSENARKFPTLTKCRKTHRMPKMQDNYETYVRPLPMQERCYCFVSWSFQIAGEDFSLCGCVKTKFKSLSNLRVCTVLYRTEQAVAV